MTPHTSRHVPRPVPAQRGSAATIVLSLLVLGIVAGGVWFGFFRDSQTGIAAGPLTDPLQRGPLRVTIMESGSLESLNSHSVVNTVEGKTAVDYVIPEGTVLTEEDVSKGTVIVRLNTATIVEKRIRQELDVSAARNGHEGAVTNLEIQLQQNASDLRKADLEIRFARIDLERYVGRAFAGRLLSVAMAPKLQAALPGAPDGGDDSKAGPPEANINAGLRRLIGSLLVSEGLEGEALQQIRKLTSDIRLADEEHRKADDRLVHSERLVKKGYISRQDYETDQSAVERTDTEEKRARTGREQYVTYDFPKAVEQLLSDVVEAGDRRSRAKKKAHAAEAQKRSAAESQSKQLELKELRLKKYQREEAECVILAPKAGLVVYSSSRSGHWRGNDERIHEGASVRQGQSLITIPDPSSLGVIIKVHETAIDKVRLGLEAAVEVDAAPGKRFRARIAEVARLPDSADRWLNPDLKVYTTKLKLLGDVTELKPGMSAQVEVLVTTLTAVLAAPAQAVAGTADNPVVYAWEDGKAVRHEVELGLTSEHHVEIKSGIAVGARLLLDPPRDSQSTDGDEDTSALWGKKGKRGPGAKGKQNPKAQGARPKKAKGSGNSGHKGAAPKGSGGAAPAKRKRAGRGGSRKAPTGGTAAGSR